MSLDFFYLQRQHWWNIAAFTEVFPHIVTQSLGASSSYMPYVYIPGHNENTAYPIIDSIADKTTGALTGFLLPITEESLRLSSNTEEEKEFYDDLSTKVDDIIKSEHFGFASVLHGAIKDLMHYGNSCVSIQIDKKNRLKASHHSIFSVMPLLSTDKEKIEGVSFFGASPLKNSDGNISDSYEIKSYYKKNKKWKSAYSDTNSLSKKGRVAITENEKDSGDPCVIYSRYKRKFGEPFGHGPGSIALSTFGLIENIRTESYNWANLSFDPPMLLDSSIRETNLRTSDNEASDSSPQSPLSIEESVTAAVATARLKDGSASLLQKSKIIWYDGENVPKPFETLLPQVNEQYTELKFQELIMIVKEIYFYDSTILPEGPRPTATEVVHDQDKKTQILLSSVQLIQQELIEPVIKKVTEMVVRQLVTENKGLKLAVSFTDDKFNLKYSNRFDLIKNEKRALSGMGAVQAITNLAGVFPEILKVINVPETLKLLSSTGPSVSKIIKNMTQAEQDKLQKEIEENLEIRLSQQ